MSKKFIQGLLLMFALSMSVGCAISPPYPFAKDEKTASMKFLNMSGAKMCRGGEFYQLAPPEGKSEALVPVGARISVGTYMSYSGYNVTYTCYPFLSFEPKEGVTYILHNGLRGDKCFVELVREDKKAETGVSFEPSIGPRDCFAKK